MSKKDIVIKEIKQLPDILLDDVLEYIKYLKTSKLSRIECGYQSESSLAKDWLNEEEEKAWQNL